MDPKKMQQLMKQMGIQQKEISAKRVTIETDDGNYIITKPQVTEVIMQGQRTFQIAGDVKLETAVSKEDVEMVMSQTGCDWETAEGALVSSDGDIAEAIISLKPER